MEENNKIIKRKVKLVRKPKIKYIIINRRKISIDYFRYLLKKYCLNNGIIYNKNNISPEEFITWVNEYKKTTKEYADFLTSYDIDLNSPSLAEVGKGMIDSIIGPEAIEVSDFSESLKRPKIILKDAKKGLIIQEDKRILTLDDLDIKRLITQNPNGYSEIDDFVTLAKRLNENITFGVYGSFSDKDIEEKNNMIKKLLESIEDTKYEFDTLNDHFYMAVTTKKPKTKVKTYNL